jgi:starvation-inducible DNA-binding protein
MFDTKINISKDDRKKVVKLLNQTLANLSDLYSQTKQAHWNVHGPVFYSFHKLFDELATSVEEHIDPTAERLKALGGVAYGTVRQAAANSILKEFPTEKDGELDYVKALIERYGQAGNAARQGIEDCNKWGDADSADLLTAVSRDLDQALWFLEAHTRK